MAKLTVRVDATRAKQELDSIRRKIRQVGAEGDKPIRPKVQANFSRTVTRNAGVANKAFTAAGAGNVAGAAQGILGALGPWGAVAAAGIALASQFEEVKSVFAQIGNAIEGFASDGKVSAERAAKGDSLDDKARRSGATYAEQYATDEARKNAFGVKDNAIFDKLSNAIATAANGDAKTGNLLADLGFSAKDFAGMNELQKQDAILERLKERWTAAEASGDDTQKNYITGQVMQLTGARNAQEVRKIFDNGAWEQYTFEKKQLQKDFEARIPKEQWDAMLKANAQREYIDSRAGIEDFYVPQAGAIVEHALDKEVEARKTSWGLDKKKAAQDSGYLPKSMLGYMSPAGYLLDKMFLGPNKEAKDTAKNTERTNTLLEELNGTIKQQKPAQTVATYS